MVLAFKSQKANIVQAVIAGEQLECPSTPIVFTLHPLKYTKTPTWIITISSNAQILIQVPLGRRFEHIL